jgi:hypothetical protein
MAITADTVAAALPSGRRPFLKNSIASKGAGLWASLWTALGQPGPGGVIPNLAAGGQLCDRNTAGAMQLPPNATLPGKLHLGQMSSGGATPGTLVIYDRLYHVGQISLAAATTQAVTAPPTITRGDPTGLDVEFFAEVTTVTAATATNLSVTYVNEANTAGRVTIPVSLNTTATVNQMLQLPLQGNDKGARQLTSVTNSVAVATGQIAIVAMRRIAEIPVSFAGDARTLSAWDVGLPEVPNDACLAAMVLCSTTSTGLFHGHYSIANLDPT